MSRACGRISSHERLRYATPYERGNKYSIMSAISSEKIVTSLYCEDSIDGNIFENFIEQCLVPQLKPMHKLIMDNVPFHKIKSVEKMIQATGAEIIYLPPYSPDLSPIELMWSKIKAILKKHAAPTADIFQNAMHEAFHAVKLSDLQGWYRHCGYKI
jgi:transposase